MKKNYYLFIFLFFLVPCISHAQTTTAATYTSGDISTDFFTGTVDTSISSNCPGTLTVSVPTGRYVTGVKIEYDFEALGFNWQSEQSSYVECVTTGTKENSVSFGPSLNSSGTASYLRNNLTFANGVVPAGGLQFRLHAWRSFTTGGCSTTAQRIRNNTFKITVTHIAAPSCLPPSNISINSVSANSVALGWTTGGASNWQIEYGPTGFSPGSGTLINATTNPFTIAGLSASTFYDFRVRDSCGTGNVSFWSNAASAQTSCSVVSAPWNEDFESSAWQPGTGFGVIGSVDTCWTRNYTNSFTMKAGPPQFSSTLSGPSGDHTTGSGKYAYSERIFFGTTPLTAYIESPPIDLTSLSQPELTFWYHMFGNDVNSLEVFVSTNGGSSFTSVFTRTGQQQLAKTAAWKEATINLTSYTNDTIVLKFEVVQTTTGLNGDVSIDDVDIHQRPSCAKPTNVSVIASTASSASLSWTTGGASNWQIEYGSPGFTPGSGTRVQATSNPFKVTGLSANTRYEFVVRDSCGASSTSAWSNPAIGKTQCTPVAAPYTENFDGTAWNRGTFTTDPGTIDGCWNRDSIFYLWKSGPAQFVSTFTGASVDHTTGSSTGKYLQTERIGFTSQGDSAVITSVPIDLSALTTPELTFWYHMFGTEIDQLALFVSDDDGATFTQENVINGQQQNSNSAAWLEATINLSAYANDTILLRFKGTHTNFGTQADICIDDVDIHEQPSCPKPQNLIATASTASTVTLSWTTGGASNWQVEYGSPGFTPGSGTLLNATSNPFTVTGLSANTRYEFVVRDSCGASSTSAWSAPVLGQTRCTPVAAPYTENFDGSAWNRGAFTTAPGTIDGCWVRDSLFYIFKSGPPQFVSTFTGASVDHTTGNSSGKYLQTERTSFTSQTDSAVITSVPIDVTALTIPELTFWYHMFGSEIDRLVLLVSDDDGATFTQEHVITGQQQTSNAAAWLEATVNLSAYANDTILLRFRGTHTNFGTQADICIDDVDVHEQPTCPKPSNLVATAATATSVTLSWTTGGASNWQIEYGSPGFSPGSGTIVNAGTNPFTVTGLNSSSTYDFYVRDSCSATDQSFWTGPETYTTDCLPLLAPFSENFDGSSWVVGTNFNDTGSVAQCWSRTPLQDYFWKPGPPIFTSTLTGPSGDHTTGSGKFIYAESIFGGGSLPLTGYIESPLIDLSALTTPELSFWYHMFGNNIGSMSVEINNGTGYTQLWSRSGQQQTSGNAAWVEQIVNLSAYANDTVKLRFKAFKNTFATLADVAIDDVSIQEAPSCPKPQSLQITGKSSNSVSLQWTTGGATNWNIEYGPVGFSPGSGTYVNATTNPFTVTGLSASTGYDFYVRDSCGVGDVSVWVGPVTDTTDCAPIPAPYTENFDGSSWVPGVSIVDIGSIDFCWVRDKTVNYVWGPTTNVTTFSTGPTADHTTGSDNFIHSQRAFGSVSQTQRALIKSPVIDLTPLTVPELTFWYHMFGADIDSLTVEVHNGTFWTTEYTLVGQQQTSKTAAWREAIVDISSYANDTIKVRFKAYRNSNFAVNSAVSIDDFDIHEQPTCPKPSGLSVTATSANSVTLSWTTGGASNWQIEYGPSGFSQGAGTVVQATTNPFTVTGLSSSTTYDFFVRDSCSATDLSGWFGRVTGATDCLPILAPFTENFDGASWTSGPNFNDTGTVAQCWTRTPLADYVWRPGPPPFTSTLTGPAADHTTGTGKYVFAESIFGGGSAPFDAYLESPEIDLTALTVPELSFWYHMFGSAIGSMALEVDSGSGYHQVWTLSGQQQTSNSDPWREVIVNLSAYANDTIQLRFKATKSSFSSLADAALDDVDIHEAPSCPKPQNLQIIGKTNSTVTLQWTGGGASDWNIVYGSPGFSPGAGTIVNATTNPFTVTGLSANTGYEFYVRDSCGLGNVSVWQGPVGDTTDCNPIAAPYTENFDGSSFVVGATAFIAGALDPCWSRDNGLNYMWAPQTTVTTTTTGPSTDHTTGSGKFLHTQRAFGTVTQTQMTTVTSPLIDLTALTIPEMTFYYHMFGADIDSLQVEVFDGSTWTRVYGLAGQQQTSKTQAWGEAIVDISAFANDTIKVRFTGHRNSTFAFNSVIAIDDLDIHEQPSCPKPQSITSTASTTTSITLSWTSGGASNWLIGYRLAGTTGPLTFVAAGSNPFTVNGLSPSTSYDFYVKDSCGTADVSDWEGPFGGTTQCGVATAPWSESFDGSSWVSGTGFDNTGNQISSCWTRPTTNNPNFGTRTGTTQSFGTGPDSDVSSTGNYLYTESSGSSGSGEITSPYIFIPTTVVNPQLKFAYHMFGTNVTSLGIKISTGGTFGANVLTLNGQQQNSGSAAWKYDSINLNTYKGDTIRVRFIGTNNGFRGDIAIDDVRIVVDSTQSCGDPTGLTFNSVTPTGFTVTWNSNGNSTVEVVPTGQAQGSGNFYYNVTSPLPVTGLMSNTGYDVYVRDSCGATVFSQWIGGDTTTLACPPITTAFSVNNNWLQTSFNSAATSNADSLYWTFGDGSNTSGGSPTHTYLAPGSYVVTLNAYSDCGSTGLFRDTIQVCDTLKADFSYTQVGDTIKFDASSSGNATSYRWDLSGNKDTTGLVVSYKFPTPGTKVVTLTVYNLCGDSVKVTKNIPVCLPPVASWTYTIISTTGAGMKTQFDGSASQNAVSYEWNFGDGSPVVTGQVMPQHTYITPGLFYTVTLKVGNTCGDFKSSKFKLNQISLEEVESTGRIDVFPNPADDELMVDWSNADSDLTQLAIYDATGKVVLQQRVDKNGIREARLNVSQLAAGYYTIRLTTEQGVVQQKLTIQ